MTERTLGVWIIDLGEVLHLQSLSHHIPNIQRVIIEKTEQLIPPGEMLLISDGESDWEKDAQ